MRYALVTSPVLPWDSSNKEEKRFRLVLFIAFLFFLAFVIIIPNIKLPEKERTKVETVPPRLAKLVTQKRKPPPPPPPPKKEEPKKKEPKKKDKPKEEPKPKEKPKPKPKPKEKPKVKVEVNKKREVAKKQAQQAAAAFDDLAALSQDLGLDALKTEQKVKQPGNRGDSKTNDRALLTKAAAGGSGGVATSRASRGGGGAGTVGSGRGLAQAGSSKVSSNINSATAAASRERASASRGAGGKSRRTSEDIARVFDQNKGSIYSLYRRALRKNPGLEGTVVLKLQIQPDGRVTKCTVVSSELNDPALERKIVLKVKRMNFGSKNVEVWNDTYPINFIPS